MKNNYDYSILDGEIIVKEKFDELLHWRGRVQGMNTLQIIPIIARSDAVILLDWREASIRRKKNLFRINPEGEIFWEVGQPPLTDPLASFRANITNIGLEIYADIRIHNTNLGANAISGFFDTIDFDTGVILSSIFTK